MSAATALAFASASVGALAAARLAHAIAPETLARLARIVAAVSAAIESALRLGREGREPGALERRRLLACGAFAVFLLGLLIAGPIAGAVTAFAAPAAVSRALHARRAAYRRAVERAAPAIALAVADALSGGRSLRAALSDSATTVPGAGGAELRRVSAELATGQPTDAALEALRRRCGAPAIDAIVAAALVQRRSGGDLGRLLRRLARAFEDGERLADEVRVATAQARFTGLLVVVLPLGGALLAEMASPGLVAAVAGSALTATLVMLAIALQLVAAVLIKRLGRVRV